MIVVVNHCLVNMGNVDSVGGGEDSEVVIRMWALKSEFHSERDVIKV